MLAFKAWLSSLIVLLLPHPLGNAVSTADANLQGVLTNAIDVDGIASIAGQTTLSNSASNVDGGTSQLPAG